MRRKPQRGASRSAHGTARKSEVPSTGCRPRRPSIPSLPTNLSTANDHVKGWIYGCSTDLPDDVTPNEISYRHRHLLWMLEQEHMAAALDLAHFASGKSVRKRRKPFC